MLIPDGHPEKNYNLTGVNDTFEIPEKPELVIDTNWFSLEECVEKLAIYLKQSVAQQQ